MIHCEKCNVYIEEGVKECPLCNSTLLNSDNAKNKSYPDYAHQEDVSHKVKNRIIAFLILAAFSIVLGLINYFTQTSLKILWSLDIIAIFAYMWVLVENTIKTTIIGSLKLIIQVVAILLLLLVFDYVAGFQNWTFNTALSIVIMAALTLSIYILIKKRMTLKYFNSYAITALVLGIIPIIAYFVKISDGLYLNLIALVYAIALFVFIQIFKNKTHPEEKIFRIRKFKNSNAKTEE